MSTYGAIKARQFEYYNPTSGQTANPWREEIDRDNVYRMKRSNGTSYNTIMRIDPTNTSGNATAASDQTFLIAAASGQTNPIMSVLDENSSTLMNVTSTVNTRNVIPRSDDTYSLGTDTLKFGTVYTDTLNFTNQSGSVTGTEYPAGSDITALQAVALYDDDGITKAKPYERLGNRGGIITFADNISHASVCALDDVRVMVAYQDADDGSYIKVCLGELVNKHIVWGNPVLVFAESSNETQIVKLDTNKVLVFSNSGTDIRTREITISGATLVMTDILTPSLGNPSYVKVSPINTTDALLTYMDTADSNHFKGVVYTGTWGSPVTLKGVGVGLNPSSVVASSTKALVSYTVGNDLFVADVDLPGLTANEKSGIAMGNTGDYTDVCIPDTDGILVVVRSASQARYVAGTTADNYTTISFGALTAVDGTDIALNLNLITISAGNVLLIGSNTNHARGYIGNVSGTSVTWGNQSGAVYSSTNVYVSNNFGTVAKLADNEFVAVGNKSGGTEEGWSRYGQLLGTNTTHWSNEWSSAETSYTGDLLRIDNERFMVAYKDSNNSNYLTVKIGKYVNGVMTFGTPVFDTVVPVDSLEVLNSDHVEMTLITESLAAIMYKESGSYRMRTVSIAGTVPTLNAVYTPSVYTITTVKSFGLVRMSDTEIATIYTRGADGSELIVRQVNISGTNLTSNFETDFITFTPVGNWLRLQLLPIPSLPRHFWAVGNTTNNQIFYWVIRINPDETPTKLTTADNSLSSVNGWSAITVGDDLALCINSSTIGIITYMVRYEIEDTRIGESTTFDPTISNQYHSIFTISNSQFGVVYFDNNKIKMRPYYVSGLIVSWTGDEYVLDEHPETIDAIKTVRLNSKTTLVGRLEPYDARNIVQAFYPRNDVLAGIAQTSATTGNNVGIKLLGERSVGHTDLVPGSRYYVADDAELTLTNTNVIAGVATSTSEIFIRNN